MKNISGYTLKIISILLLIWNSTFFVVAGENEDYKKLFYGFFVDLDLAEPFLSMLNTDKFGLNASVQIDIRHTIYPVLETGYSTYEGASDYSYLTDLIEQPSYRYSVKGAYYKIGADINLLAKDFTEKINSIGYMGIRYGISPFSYNIENLVVKDFYWDQTDIFNASGTTIGQWAEFVAGVKTPIYRNLCLSADVRFKQFLYVREKRTGNNVVRQSYVPGFGDKDDGKWGFRYTISYFFPFNK